MPRPLSRRSAALAVALVAAGPAACDRSRPREDATSRQSAAAADLAAKADLFVDAPPRKPDAAADEREEAAPPAATDGTRVADAAGPPAPDGGEAPGEARFFADAPSGEAPRSEVLELRLSSLAGRVAQMHHAWSTEADEWSQRAMELQARKLQARLDPVVRRVEQRATASVHVRHLQAQRVLYDHRGAELRNPASNQKMLTASAALDLLGPEYRFETRVRRTADAVYLVGGGDPTLTSDGLARLAAALAAGHDLSGLTAIVVDESAFSAERFIPGFALDDVGFAYTAPTGALSLDDNVVTVTVGPGAAGQPVRVHVTPESHHVALDVQARSLEGVDTALSVRTLARGPQTVVEVRGRMRAGDKPVVERRRVYDPGLFTGEVFAAALATAAGAARLEVRRGAAPPTAHLLETVTSMPLVDVVRDALAYSNNFATEQVLRTLAWRMSGSGSFEEGKRILERYWSTVGVTPRALVVDNGSGLSREGRFTARGLVDLLSAAHLAQPPNSGLLSVLPVAGQAGTLRHRQLQARGRLRAKTGTLDGVSALTGVLTSVSGDPVLALSIMLNPTRTDSLDVGARHAAEEDIVRVLLDFVDEQKAPRAARR